MSEPLAGGRAEALAGGGAEAGVMPWRASASLALPKEPPLARVAQSIVAWASKKCYFHFDHVFSMVGSSFHFSRAVGKLFLARMELVAMAVIHASEMGRATRDDFFWPSLRRFTYLGTCGYPLHQFVMVYWRATTSTF